jgi:hypothetical protein
MYLSIACLLALSVDPYPEKKGENKKRGEEESLLSSSMEGRAMSSSQGKKVLL